MESLFWSILFCTIMIIMAIVEALTISMGIFTALSVLSALLSIYMGFHGSPSLGYTMLGVNTVLFPTSLFLTLKYLRQSPMMLDDDIQAGVPREKKVQKPADQLIGQQGVALTYLRPSGTAQFGERRLDVVTDGKYVPAGQKVRVIKVNGFMTVVEAVEEPPAAQPDAKSA